MFNFEAAELLWQEALLRVAAELDNGDSEISREKEVGRIVAEKS